MRIPRTCRSTSSASEYCLLKNSRRAALFAACTSHLGERLAMDSALCKVRLGEKEGLEGGDLAKDSAK